MKIDTHLHNFSPSKDNVRSVIQVLTSFAGFCFFLKAGYPGYMSLDSLGQYKQSISHRYTDQHPPVMAWLWSALNQLFDGPQGMLVFHLLLFWGAIYLFMLRFKDERWWLFPVLGILPWIANFEAVLWKDVGMAFSLVAAIALLSFSRSRARLLSTLLLLLYGLMVRKNAFFALCPLIFLWVISFFPDMNKRLSLTLSIIVLTVMCTFSNVFTSMIIRPLNHYLVISLLEDDLIHISLKAERNLLPGIDFELVKKCGAVQLSYSNFYLHKNEDYRKVAESFQTCAYKPAYAASVKKAWKDAITQYPLEYIKYRLSVFKALMRTPGTKPYFVTNFVIKNNTIGIVKQRNSFTLLLEKYVVYSIDKTPLFFKPFFWLLLGIILSVLSFRLSGDLKIIYLIRTLLLSAVIYITGYLPITTASDFRYVYWSIVSINLASIIYLSTDNVFFKHRDKTTTNDNQLQKECYIEC
jgi:hypothetical protein